MEGAQRSAPAGGAGLALLGAPPGMLPAPAAAARAAPARLVRPGAV